MIIKEDINNAVISKLTKMAKDIQKIRITLSNANIDRDSDEGKQIAELLTDIWWELDYLEDIDYFDVRR